MASSKIEIPANYVTGILGASGGYDEGHLISAEDSRRFCGVATFLKAPLLKDVAEPTVGFVGIPFDGGSSRTGGSQFGPRGVREASFRVSGYNSELDVRPYDIHNLADCGDMLVSPFSITDTYKSIELGLKSLLDRGIVPIAIGGDHSVTLPLLRAMHAKHGQIALVHFDAHCDVSDTQFGSPYHYGSVFRRAVEEKLIHGDKTFQIGIRKHYHKGEIEFVSAEGDAVAFSRRYGNEEIVCAFNLGAGPATIDLGGGRIVQALAGHGFSGALDGGTIRLDGYGAWFGRLA